LTTNLNDAKGYGDNIIKVNLKPRKIIQRKKLSGNVRNDAIKIINNSPNMDTVLSNWGYDPGFSDKTEIFNQMIESVINEEDEADTFQQIWYDLYHDNRNGDQLFIKEMIKYKYDMAIYERQSATHAIVYNPKIITILN